MHEASPAEEHERRARALGDGREACAAWICAGEAWERGDEPARALPCYRRAYQAGAEDEGAAEALRRARRVYAARGDWEMVAELLAVEIDAAVLAREEVAALWVEMGDVAREHLGDMERAAACYEAAGAGAGKENMHHRGSESTEEDTEKKNGSERRREAGAGGDARKPRLGPGLGPGLPNGPGPGPGLGPGPGAKTVAVAVAEAEIDGLAGHAPGSVERIAAVRALATALWEKEEWRALRDLLDGEVNAIEPPMNAETHDALVEWLSDLAALYAGPLKDAGLEIGALERVSEIAPANGAALERLAACFAELGRARDEFRVQKRRAAIEGARTSAQIWRRIAQLAEGPLGDPDEAILALETLRHVSAAAPEVETRLLAALRAAGLWDRVVEIGIERFERGGFSREEFRALVAEADERGLRDDLAGRAWGALLDGDARDDEAFERLVSVDLKANRFVGAVDRLMKRATAAKDPSARAALSRRAGGVLLNRLARADEAEAAFAESFALVPEDGPAFRALVDFAWHRSDAARVAELFGRRNDEEGLVAELSRVALGKGSERTRVKAALELARRTVPESSRAMSREAALRFVWESREARSFERAEAVRGLTQIYRAASDPVDWARFVAESIGALPADEAARRLLEVAEACGDAPALEGVLIEALDALSVDAVQTLGHEAVAVVAAIEARVRARASANAVVAWIDDALAALASDSAQGGVRAAFEGVRARLLHRVAGRGEEALAALERLSEAALVSNADNRGERINAINAWIAAARGVDDASSLARALATRVAALPAAETVDSLRELAAIWESAFHAEPGAEEKRAEIYGAILARAPGDVAAALKLSKHVAHAGDGARAIATLQGALDCVDDSAGRQAIATELFRLLARAGDWDAAIHVAEGELEASTEVESVFREAAAGLLARPDAAVARRFVAWARRVGWSRVPAPALATLYGAARAGLDPAESADDVMTLLREEMAIHQEFLGDAAAAFDTGLLLARLCLDGALLDSLVGGAERLGRVREVALVAEESLAHGCAPDALAVHRALAGLYETRLGDPSAAIRHRRAVIAVSGDDHASWVALARLAEETEAWAELREILRHLTGMDAARGEGAASTSAPSHDRERAGALERLMALELDILRDGASALETARTLVGILPEHLGGWRTIVRLLGETPEAAAQIELRLAALRRLRVLESALPPDGRLPTLLALGRELATHRETANEAAGALVVAAGIPHGVDEARTRLGALLELGWLDGPTERAALRVCGRWAELAELLEEDAERAVDAEAIDVLTQLAEIYATEGGRPDRLREALQRLVLLSPRDAALRARYLEVVEATAAWDEYVETGFAAAAALPDDDEEVWAIMVDLYVIASRELPGTQSPARTFAAIVARAGAALVRDGSLPAAAQKAIAAALESAAPSETRAAAVTTLVESFVRAGEAKHAAEVLQRAVERAADEREAATWLEGLAVLCATRLDRGETAAGLFVDAGDLWSAAGDAKAARAAYERAVPLAAGEGLAKVHVALGNSLRGDPAREAEAVAHYDAALDLLARVDTRAPFSLPDDLVPFRRIDEILTARRDWKPLERAYRHMIARVAATQFKPLLVLLWRNLGEIYRSRLGDAARAAQAFGVVVELAPDDEAAKKLLDALRTKST